MRKQILKNRNKWINRYKIGELGVTMPLWKYNSESSIITNYEVIGVYGVQIIFILIRHSILNI